MKCASKRIVIYRELRSKHNPLLVHAASLDHCSGG